MYFNGLIDSLHPKTSRAVALTARRSRMRQCARPRAGARRVTHTGHWPTHGHAPRPANTQTRRHTTTVRRQRACSNQPYVPVAPLGVPSREAENGAPRRRRGGRCACAGRVARADGAPPSTHTPCPPQMGVGLRVVREKTPTPFTPLSQPRKVPFPSASSSRTHRQHAKANTCSRVPVSCVVSWAIAPQIVGR